MQLLGLVNTLLAADSRTTDRGLRAVRYAVVPLSPFSGLIGWLVHCDTLYTLISEHRADRKVLIDLETRLIHDFAPDYKQCSLMQKVEALDHAMESSDGSDLRRVRPARAAPGLRPRPLTCAALPPAPTRPPAALDAGAVGGGVAQPPYALHEDLGPHEHGRLRARPRGQASVQPHDSPHVREGDSHRLWRLLRGACPYGHARRGSPGGAAVNGWVLPRPQVTMVRDAYPEKVPFRLTRMLVNAMEVGGIDGSFRHTSVSVLSVLRRQRDSVLAMLEAFVHDPLVNWCVALWAPARPKGACSHPHRRAPPPTYSSLVGASCQRLRTSSHTPPPPRRTSLPGPNWLLAGALPTASATLVRTRRAAMRGRRRGRVRTCLWTIHDPSPPPAPLWATSGVTDGRRPARSSASTTSPSPS